MAVRSLATLHCPPASPHSRSDRSPAQNDRPAPVKMMDVNFIVAVCFFDGLADFRRHAGGDGVQALRPVQRDRGDASFSFIGQGFGRPWVLRLNWFAAR